MDANLTPTLSKFTGVNNVDPIDRLLPEIVDHEYVFPLREANNVEIDNSFKLKSRSGFTSVKTGTDIHSIWSDDKETVCFYVDGSTLYQMDVIYGTKTVRTGLTSGARMSYVQRNDRIYYSNGYQIGYVVNAVDYGLVDPLKNFKRLLPAGQVIEVFENRLFVANGKKLYISDPLCDYYDTRNGYKQFVNYITMLRSVDKGLYASDDRIWFIKADLSRVPVYLAKAVIHTDVRFNGQEIKDELQGNVAMWTGETGICLGDNNGNVVNLTEDRYVYAERGKGTGFIRDKNHVKHYINSLF